MAALAAAALAAGLASAAGAASTAGTSGWARVTQPGLRNTDQLATARTPDGVLHLAWLRVHGATSDLMHGSIAASGAVGPQAPALAGWGSLTNPTILAGAGGLELLFAGIRSTSTADPYSGGTVYRARGGGAGAAWTLDANPVAPPSSAYASDVVAAAYDGSGALVTAWASTYGTDVHGGDDPATPATVVQAPCCGYQTGLATDGKTGQVVLGWFSNATGQEGLHARAVSPALGVERYLPGSGDASRTSAASPIQQVAVSGRVGAPGVYVLYGTGYPVWTDLSLFSASTGQVRRIAQVTVRHVALGRGPAGRLWLMWSDGTSISAARTNMAATRIGPVVSTPLPPGASDLWKIEGDGTPGDLDLFASATTSGSIAYWHTRVQARLTLASRIAAPTGTVTLALTDAGDPVAGARVTVAGRALTTDAHGQATLRLQPGRYPVQAAKVGYAALSQQLTVPPRR